jgi:hypothetical protein
MGKSMAAGIVIWNLAMVLFGIGTGVGWDGYWLSQSGEVCRCDTNSLGGRRTTQEEIVVGDEERFRLVDHAGLH